MDMQIAVDEEASEGVEFGASGLLG